MSQSDGAWRHWVQRPQTVPLRRAVLQIHLWTGLILGLYILVVALSGIILVFQHELHRWSYPELYTRIDAISSGATASSVDLMVRRLESRYPGRKAWTIFAPTEEVHAYETFATHSAQAQGLRVFSDPNTGEPLGAIDRDRSLLRWLERLHFDLLIPKVGRAVNGVGGGFLAALCLTGVVIWWPGIRNWRRGLKVDFRRTWKRWNWDLHSAMGIWSLLFLLMWGLTAVYFGFPKQTKKAISRLSPVSEPSLPKPDPQGKGLPPIGIDAAIARAKGRIPGLDLVGVALPRTPSASYIVYLAHGPFVTRQLAMRRAAYVSVDRRTGAILGTYSRGNHQSAGDVVIAWIQPLHFGDFGGLAVKIVWAIAGLAPCVLVITGCLMYWNRYLSKRWSQWTASADE